MFDLFFYYTCYIAFNTMLKFKPQSMCFYNIQRDMLLEMLYYPYGIRSILCLISTKEN